MPIPSLLRAASRAALAALAFVACTSATLPADGPMRYALVALDGHPLPALTDSSATELGIILGDTISMDGHGAADRRFVMRRVQPAINYDVTQQSAFRQEYRFGPGDRVEIGWFTPCPPNASCIANQVGTRAGVEMELPGTFYGYGHRLTYRRFE